MITKLKKYTSYKKWFVIPFVFLLLVIFLIIGSSCQSFFNQEESSEPELSESTVTSQPADSSFPSSSSTTSPPSGNSHGESTTTSQGAAASTDPSNAATSATPGNEPTGNKKGDDYYAVYRQQTDLGWNLKLANASNVDANYVPEVVSVAGNLMFDKRAASNLKSMVSDCQTKGINIWPQSTYRTLQQQTKLLNNEINDWVNKGYSQKDAREKALQAVMEPGGSDHNLGLAVDFNTITQAFENTAAFRWLMQHAADYGFVLRYPKDKTKITKVMYEPWHFRYVGKQHATEMNRKNMCLEEYIAFLEGNYE